MNKGIKKQLELYLEEMEFETMAVEKENVDKIDIEVNSIFYLEAPVAKHQIIGNLQVIVNNEKIDILNIYAIEEIRKKEMKDYLLEFLEVYGI